MLFKEQILCWLFCGSSRSQIPPATAGWEQGLCFLILLLLLGVLLVGLLYVCPGWPQSLCRLCSSGQGLCTGQVSGALQVGLLCSTGDWLSCCALGGRGIYSVAEPPLSGSYGLLCFVGQVPSEQVECLLACAVLSGWASSQGLSCHLMEPMGCCAPWARLPSEWVGTFSPALCQGLGAPTCGLSCHSVVPTRCCAPCTEMPSHLCCAQWESIFAGAERPPLGVECSQLWSYHGMVGNPTSQAATLKAFAQAWLSHLLLQSCLPLVRNCDLDSLQPRRGKVVFTQFHCVLVHQPSDVYLHGFLRSAVVLCRESFADECPFGCNLKGRD